MSCAEVSRLLHPYVDGELDAAHVIQIDEHLAECPACAQALDELNRLGAALRSPELRYQSPANFKPLRSKSDYRWLAMAAAVVLVAFLGWRFLPQRSNDVLVHDLMASHVRSLMADHLVDVRSSDRHTVKPWFTGKIDFSPDVEDFAVQGFPLIGGRLDYIDGHSAVALAYQRNKHVINVYTWPGDGPSRSGSESGFQFEHWTHAGMNYWAVSDVNRADLEELAHLIGR